MIQSIAIVNLIITIQAFFLCIHFVFKKKGIRVLNLLLALLTGCFSVIVFNTYYSLSAFEQSLMLQDISNNLMWFIGPINYLYVKYKTDQFNTRLIQIHLIPYLIPFTIDVAFTIEFYDSIIPMIGFIQMILYLTIAILNAYQVYPQKKAYFAWVLPFIVVFFALVISNFILRILESFDLIYLSSIVKQSFTTLLMFPIFYLSYKEMNSEKSAGQELEKYEKTKLSEQRSKEILAAIQTELVHNQAFKIQSITLSDLSKKLDIPTKYISQIINQELNQKFTEYLLSLRMNHVKSELTDPKNAHLSIVGIAENSGFKSGSRFNHLFKIDTGLTPSEYRKKYA